VKGGDEGPTKHVKNLLAGDIGKPLDRGQLRDELGSVYADGGVRDIVITGVQEPDGVSLTVTLVQQPKVHAFSAVDSTGAPIALPPSARVVTGMRLDPNLLDSFATALRDDYLNRGFADVQVNWNLTPAGTDAVDVKLELVPGTASIIDKRDYKGNAHAPAKELDAAIGATVVPGSPWRDDEVERAMLLIQAYYYDHGFVNVRVAPPTRPQGRAPLVFDITEGDLFHLGTIEVTGVDAATAKKYRAQVKLKTGDVFKRSAIAEAMEKLRTATQADVLPLTELDVAKKTIAIKFEVQHPQ